MEILIKLLLKIKYCIRVMEIFKRANLKSKLRNKIQQRININQFS